MGNKYGIIQTSRSICVLYKEDDEGYQSLFTVLHPIKSQKPEMNRIIVFIDNEQDENENQFIDDISTSKRLIEVFDDWADEAPVGFQMEAYSSLINCTSNRGNKP
jgi:hypothetical protein